MHGGDDAHPHHYPTTADGYDVYEEIGSGAFATVYHAVVKETGESVAIKVIDLDQFNTNWEEIRREIQIMSLVHHKNVVRILTSFVDGQDLWIIMPLLEAGSCAAIMKQIYPHGIKDEALIATILKEVLHGLLYFHNDSRMHRDLKAGNVIISKTGEVQLADFGVAVTLQENGDRKKGRTFTGTPCWMAPEVMEHSERGYDEKADVWSLGITAMELAYGRAPYAKFPPMKVMVLTLQEDPPTCDIYKDHSYEFSRHFYSMLGKCLRKDPEKRPTVKKLLEHKFFKQAKDSKYIVEKIVKRLPQKRLDTNAKPVNLAQLRHPSLVGGSSSGYDPSDRNDRPVSVGSWVFDKDEFDAMKRQALEEKERAGAQGSRDQSVQQSYVGDEEGKTDGEGAALHPLSSGEEDSTDHSDDEQQRAAAGHASPDTASPHPAASPLTSSPHPDSQPHLQPGPSPSPTHHEHQEGRFRVSEDTDEDDDHQHEHDHDQHYDDQQHQQYQDHDHDVGQYSSDHPPDSSDAHAPTSGIVYHNEAYVDESDPSLQPQAEEYEREREHATQVGRFAVTDDGDDEEDDQHQYHEQQQYQQ